MSSELLKVDSLSLETNNGFIVRDLSFEINKSEIVAMTGRSGSGKTSIALALLGIFSAGVRMTSGSIKFFGNDGSVLAYPLDKMLWPSLRGTHIGYIQQDVFGAFDPILQVGKQMLMIIRERAQQKNTDHTSGLKAILSELGIIDVERIWSSYPHQLSGGQLQRCLLSMSIMIRPEILIADEPTSAIDKINQQDLFNVLALIRKKYNMAILCISHDRSVVDQLADREIQIEKPDQIRNSTERKKAEQPENNNILLETKGLGYSHRFGGLSDKKGAVISDISFKISASDCIGIIGESGSGKSTLAQMLVGLLIPSEGELLIERKPVDFRLEKDIRFLRSKVQLVMQDGRGSLHPNKTIRELLAEVMYQHSVDKATILPAIINSLHEVGLPSDVLDRRAGNLSGGECLRVNIARALLVDPDVLICDESTSALDEATRNGIIALLAGLLRKRKMGLIVISHDDMVIRELADEILVFSDGKIVDYGPAKEMLLNPGHPVAKKIFSPEATFGAKKHL